MEKVKIEIELDEGEVYFLLRSNDKLAANCVREWVKSANKWNINPRKVASAQMILEKMDEINKDGKSRLPD